MNWIKWLFCTHDWSKLIQKFNVEYVLKGVRVKYLYQCSKCSRFKLVSVS